MNLEDLDPSFARLELLNYFTHLSYPLSLRVSKSQCLNTTNETRCITVTKRYNKLQMLRTQNLLMTTQFTNSKTTTTGTYHQLRSVYSLLTNTCCLRQSTMDGLGVLICAALTSQQLNKHY